LFAGEQFDPNLGLYYNRARYLDVQLGRFWGMDTRTTYSLNDPFDLHQYLYASANPVNRIDPSGMDDIAEVEVSAGISQEAGAIEVEGQQVAFQAQELAEEIETVESDAVQETDNLYESWQDAENGVRQSEGAAKKTFDTLNGTVKRFVDAYNPLSKTATEVKYGRKALTNFIERQVKKDVDLLANNPSVKKVVWKFFTSAATGEGGPTAPLLKLLLDSNIEVWVDGALQVAEVVP
jgi:RHS repeat-associated protein